MTTDNQTATPTQYFTAAYRLLVVGLLAFIAFQLSGLPDKGLDVHVTNGTRGSAAVNVKVTSPVSAWVANAVVPVQGSVDAKVTNSSLNVEGFVSARVTNLLEIPRGK